MKRKINFRGFCVIYAVLLVFLCATALLYVHFLLQRYEAFRPERYVSEAVELLREQAESSTLHIAYALDKPENSLWEKDSDIWHAYEEQYLGDLSIIPSQSSPQELVYTIADGEFPLARVTLRAKGEAYTRLLILQYQEWEVACVEPIFKARTYDVTLPQGYHLMVNGQESIPSENTYKEEQVQYLLEKLYLKPTIEITNPQGSVVPVRITEDKIIPTFYAYHFTLPSQIEVTVNGNALEGIRDEDGLTDYEIHEVNKPTILLEDKYGNSITYEANREIPLFYQRLFTESPMHVAVNDMSVPDEVVTVKENPEYQPLKEYVPNLPDILIYEIAVLENEPDILVTDEAGREVLPVKDGQTGFLVASREGADVVPSDVAQQVDVLQNAKDWSLFMSNDKPFSNISSMLLKDSYQYKVAKSYATGVDITFTSEHTLKNPPFTEESVTNYVLIAPNCFSVDISFVKHMLIGQGKPVDDVMNDRFYYVFYDETDDGVDNSQWKLVSMKEIVDDGE